MAAKSELTGVVVSSTWFFGVALIFGRYIKPKRMAEIEEFFATMHRPVEAATRRAVTSS